MSRDDERRADQQRAERARQDRAREQQRVEQRRLDAMREQRRVEQVRLDAMRERERVERARAEGERACQLGRDVDTQRREAASRARTTAILSDPNSYLGGEVPPASAHRPHGPERLRPVRQPVSYPSAPIDLRAWEEHRHPEVTGVFVEVTPLMGGGVQAGLDWPPRFGRVLLTAKDLTHHWQEHRRGGVQFPIEMRQTASGMSLRWLAPTPSAPAADLGGLRTLATGLVTVAAVAAWRSLANRTKG